MCLCYLKLYSFDTVPLIAIESNILLKNIHLFFLFWIVCSDSSRDTVPLTIVFSAALSIEVVTSVLFISLIWCNDFEALSFIY